MATRIMMVAPSGAETVLAVEATRYNQISLRTEGDGSRWVRWTNNVNLDTRVSVAYENQAHVPREFALVFIDLEGGE